MKKIYYWKNGNEYRITAPDAETLKISAFFEGRAFLYESIIKVNNSLDYTIKVNKRSITARDGAPGLLDFFERCIRENFMLLYLDKVIETF